MSTELEKRIVECEKNLMLTQRTLEKTQEVVARLESEVKLLFISTNKIADVVNKLNR